jgi:hypothetical protein
MKGRLSTVDLLLVNNLDYLLLKIPPLNYFLTKQATIMRSSTVLRLTLQLGFTAKDIRKDKRLTSSESLMKGSLSTVDLLLTTIDHLLLILATFTSFLTKQATLMRCSSVLRLPLPLVFPV